MNADTTSNQDLDHLNLLVIFHYVVAGMTGLFALFPIFHLIFGILMVFAPQVFTDHGQPPPAFFGWFFIVFALGFITVGMVLAVLIFSAGRCLARRKAYMFCFVMAAVECLMMPFGTVLGIFTIIVLNRSSVKALFYTRPSP